MPTSSDVLILRGAAALHGRLRVPAAKNGVLPQLAAALLCTGPLRLQGVPRLADVQAACGILAGLGRPARREGADMLLAAGTLNGCRLDAACMGRMRSGVFFLAPVLALCGAVEFAAPGGCDLGERPVDIHLEGLARMGARLLRREGCTRLEAPQGLRGCVYRLRLPSVGATETLLMAATAARGVTRLENAAIEPEVLDLARFINALGGHIEAPAHRTFVIQGVGRLRGGVFAPAGDRIWAATLLCAAAGCGGEVELEGLPPGELSCLPQLLCAAGCRVHTGAQSICVAAAGRLRGLGTVRTAPFPGFATDMAPLLAAALLRAQGPTTVCDTVFTRRFACAQGFAALGAPVCLRDNCLTVGTLANAPPPLLRGAALCGQDLRGSAALVLAALQAQGVSRLRGLEYLLRGYEDLPGALHALGAPAPRCCPADAPLLPRPAQTAAAAGEI